MRLAPRRLSAAATAVLLGGGLLVTAQAPASAASWETVTLAHGAKLQACTNGDRTVVRFRLRNEAGDHAHRGGFYRTRGDVTELFQVRARRGATSRVGSFGVRVGDSLESMAGEIEGPTQGGGTSVTDLPRC